MVLRVYARKLMGPFSPESPQISNTESWLTYASCKADISGLSGPAARQEADGSLWTVYRKRAVSALLAT